MKTVLIVEDNSRNLEMLVSIIKDLEEQITIHTASKVSEAYDIIMKYNIDLFLIDIILEPLNPGDVSGINFANDLRDMKRYQYTPIIFTTSLEDPKLYAYSEIHCFYYIEKPYDIKKASQIISQALSIPRTKIEKKNVFFRKDGILYKKDVSDVLYIENSRAGQTVHFTSGELKLPYKPTKNILQELNCDNFVQCSRYVIVNIDYVDSVDIINRYIMLKGCGEKIEIGIAYKNEFIKDITDD